MKPTVISFYTPEWRYPEFAEKLRKDCQRHRLQYLIEERESKNDYVKNCNIKPEFIKEKLLETKGPVIWIDVDGSIVKLPRLMIDAAEQNYDIAANRPLHDIKRIHVGSFMLNYTQPILDFIDHWLYEIKRKNGIDDAAFNGVFRDHQDKMKILELPAEYFTLLAKHSDPVPEQAVIVHRLSSSDLKWAYKNRVEKRI